MSTQPKGVTLSFRKPVPYMLEQANLFHSQLTDDIADFTAVDSTVDATYLTAFQDAITAAEDAENPMQAAGDLGYLTENVNDLMEQARNSVQELYFFVGKAYPGHRSKLNQYGKEIYVKARANHSRMVDLMDRLTANIADDSADLIAAGYAQAKIDAFGTLFASLKTANESQEKQKSINLGVTDEYYTKPNAVWAIMSQISELSKIVYSDDYVKRKIYLLYDPVHSGLSFSLTVPVAPGAAFHHIEEPLQPDTILKFNIVEGNGSAWVCFANAEGDPCNGPKKNVPNGGEAEFTYILISNGSSQYLRVNQDGTVPLRINVLVPGL